MGFQAAGQAGIEQPAQFLDGDHLLGAIFHLAHAVEFAEQDCSSELAGQLEYHILPAEEPIRVGNGEFVPLADPEGVEFRVVFAEVDDGAGTIDFGLNGGSLLELREDRFGLRRIQEGVLRLFDIGTNSASDVEEQPVIGLPSLGMKGDEPFRRHTVAECEMDCVRGDLGDQSLSGFVPADGARSISSQRSFEVLVGEVMDRLAEDGDAFSWTRHLAAGRPAEEAQGGGAEPNVVMWACSLCKVVLYDEIDKFAEGKFGQFAVVAAIGDACSGGFGDRPEGVVVVRGDGGLEELASWSWLEHSCWAVGEDEPKSSRGESGQSVACAQGSEVWAVDLEPPERLSCCRFVFTDSAERVVVGVAPFADVGRSAESRKFSRGNDFDSERGLFGGGQSCSRDVQGIDCAMQKFARNLEKDSSLGGIESSGEPVADVGLGMLDVPDPHVVGQAELFHS